MQAGLRARIEADIAAEMERQPQPPSTDADVELFASSPLLAAALARVDAARDQLEPPSEGIDSSRYALPAPTELADVDAWRSALDNASAQLEHQRARIGTLELIGRFGSNAWRIDNFLLERDVERTKRELESVKTATEDVNRRRKTAQIDAGERLTELETRWRRLISASLQLEIANLGLENELSELSKRQSQLLARIDVASA